MESSWLVFDRLTAYDAKLKPQPMLAESWDFSPDYKSFKLNLRKGVQYHNGRELTSEDVKYSLLRPRTDGVGNGILTGISNWFTTIETPDKYTVEIKTDVLAPGLLRRAGDLQHLRQGQCRGSRRADDDHRHRVRSC